MIYPETDTLLNITTQSVLQNLILVHLKSDQKHCGCPEQTVQTASKNPSLLKLVLFCSKGFSLSKPVAASVSSAHPYLAKRVNTVL